MGYYLMGFDVIGVDIAAQKRYPFPFFQADALEFVKAFGHEFDAIHASPPCQAFSPLAKRWPERDYPDLITPLRPLLENTGRPYVIENVPAAPLQNPVTLCGSTFGLVTSGLQLRRHRAFETNWPLPPIACAHYELPVISVTGHAGRASRNNSGSSLERREAMQIPWLGAKDIAEAIPPAYTRYIGSHLFQFLTRAEAVSDAA
jgi:DNA (cytosine-5)-methyltransferase 1